MQRAGARDPPTAVSSPKYPSKAASGQRPEQRANRLRRLVAPRERGRGTVHDGADGADMQTVQGEHSLHHGSALCPLCTRLDIAHSSPSARMLTDARVILPIRPPFASISILCAHPVLPHLSFCFCNTANLELAWSTCRTTTTPSLGTDVAALTARPRRRPTTDGYHHTLHCTAPHHPTPPNTTSLVAWLRARLSLSLSLSLIATHP
jgi:hypothetical protein